MLLLVTGRSSILFLCCSDPGARLIGGAESSRCPKSEDASRGKSKWVQHQDHCYAFDMSFYNYSVYSKEKASSICQSMGELQLWQVRGIVSTWSNCLTHVVFLFSWQMLNCWPSKPRRRTTLCQSTSQTTRSSPAVCGSAWTWMLKVNLRINVEVHKWNQKN